MDIVTKALDSELVAGGEEEDIWAYDDKGKKWGSRGNLPVDEA